MICLRWLVIIFVLALNVINQETLGSVLIKDNLMHQPIPSKLIVKSNLRSKGNIVVSAKGPKTLLISVNKGSKNQPKIGRGNFVVHNDLPASEDWPNAKRNYIIKCCGPTSTCNFGNFYWTNERRRTKNNTSSTTNIKSGGATVLIEGEEKISGNGVTTPGKNSADKSTPASTDEGGEGGAPTDGGESGGDGGTEPGGVGGNPDSTPEGGDTTPDEGAVNTDTAATAPPAVDATTNPQGSDTSTSSGPTSSQGSSGTESSGGAATASNTPVTNCPNLGCPAVPCEPNQGLMMAAAAGMLPPALGAMHDACEKQYVFAAKQGPSTDAINACCALGKKLASMETATEIKCLADYAKKNSVNTTMKYWLSGVDIGCAGGYKWCSLDLLFDQKENLWMSNEPLSKSANNSNCVAAYLETPGYGLSVEPCDSQLGFICE